MMIIHKPMLRRRNIFKKYQIPTCVVWVDETIGSYLYKNEAGWHVTCNGERYRAMIDDYLCLNWKMLMWTTLGFNKTALYALQSK